MNPERFERWTDIPNMKDHIYWMEKRVDFLMEKLKTLGGQEPVAWWDGKESVVFAHDTIYTPNWTDYWTTPLYIGPKPQREWVGLTDEEHTKIQHEADYNQFMSASEFAVRCQVLVENKLKEKNNG
jgi:hypothetical protein